MGQNTNTGASQRSNKPLIIGIIVAAVILVVVLAVALVSKNSTKKSSENSIERATLPQSTLIALNKFTNYILDGKESDASPNQRWDWESNNALNGIYKNELKDAERQEFLEKSNELKEDFKTEINTIKVNNDDQYLASRGNGLINNFELFSQIVEIGPKNDELIYQNYLDSKVSDVKISTMGQYSVIKGLDSPVSQEFYDLLDHYVDAALITLDIYRNYGCIKSTDYSLSSLTACILSSPLSNEEITKLNNHSQIGIEIDNYIEKLISDIFKNSFSIYNYIGV